MFRDFSTILKDMTVSSVHTPTALGNEDPKRKGKFRPFKSIIGEAKPAVPAPDLNAIGKRALQPNGDGATAKSPFLYDPNVLGSLRPDQVPRFYGAITDSDKLPTKELKLDELYSTQDRVDPGKVKAIAENGAGGKNAVVVRHNGKHYIADGHHRLAADWLAGKESATVAYKDLEPVDHALKRAPQVDLEVSKILKVDEGEGIVYGWAVVSKVDGKPYYDLNIDHSGPHAGERVPEHIPESALAKCALGFVDGGAPGNEMHEGPDVGDFPFVMPMTTELFKGLFGDREPPKTGLIVGFRPPVDVLAKFRSGQFTGFSIEGSRLAYMEHQA
jgi:hypothetical protein